MHPMMSPNAPEFVPITDDLLYSHLMLEHPYAQQQMPIALYPGGRPLATPNSDRNIAEIDMQKTPLEHRAFGVGCSMDHNASIVPPVQHVPGEPQWPLPPLESSAPAAMPMLPSPPAGLPGDAAPGFAIARGFGFVDAEREKSSNKMTSTISPTSVVARPPPGLEDEAAVTLAEPALSTPIENQPVMRDMSIQTDGPACNACGAAFGCAGKCPWSRNQLLGLREAFLRTKVEPKESNALKTMYRTGATVPVRQRIGGA